MCTMMAGLRGVWNHTISGNLTSNTRPVSFCWVSEEQDRAPVRVWGPLGPRGWGCAALGEGSPAPAASDSALLKPLAPSNTGTQGPSVLSRRGSLRGHTPSASLTPGSVAPSSASLLPPAANWLCPPRPEPSPLARHPQLQPCPTPSSGTSELASWSLFPRITAASDHRGGHFLDAKHVPTPVLTLLDVSL